MSHANITLPIRVEYIENPGKLLPVSRRLRPYSPTDEYHCHPDRSGQLQGPFDPWQLRDDFLKWPHEQWQGFVAMAGCLGPLRVSERSFELWQKAYRAALIRPAREWKALDAEFGLLNHRVRVSQPLRISFDWDGHVPIARVRTVTTLEAIVATIQVDKLQGAEFRVCARHDCKSGPFRVEARHKIYCSSDCAHLVAVRKSRKQASNANSKATKKAPSRKLRGGKSE